MRSFRPRHGNGPGVLRAHGGGFGAKQEMLVEDIVALAVLKTRQPVKLEFTREEQSLARRRGIPCGCKSKPVRGVMVD